MNYICSEKIIEMLLTGIFHTVEFYIITAFVAAAVVAFAAMPQKRGAVRTFLYGGELIGGDGCVPEEPEVIFSADGNGRMTILRKGLEGIGLDGAYSLAVKISGFDVVIEERLVAGRMDAGEASRGRVVADCFGAERYHILYRSEALGISTAFYLTVRPDKILSRQRHA